MDSIASSVSARHLLASSIIARRPPAMLTIGLAGRTQRLTGCFTTAGLVTGADPVALGAAGHLVGVG